MRKVLHHTQALKIGEQPGGFEFVKFMANKGQKR